MICIDSLWYEWNYYVLFDIILHFRKQSVMYDTGMGKYTVIYYLKDGAAYHRPEYLIINNIIISFFFVFLLLLVLLFLLLFLLNLFFFIFFLLLSLLSLVHMYYYISLFTQDMACVI